MSATGKITTAEITRRPLGTVTVLITDQPGGRLPTSTDANADSKWLPTHNKTGMTAATVTDFRLVTGARTVRYELVTDRGVVADLTGAQTFWLAPEASPAPAPQTATVEPAAVALTPAEPAGETFDPTAVQIERHRMSVTQGEVSVSYRGELLGRYGDRVQICTDKARDHGGAVCFGGFCGQPDRHWIDAAAWAVADRVSRPGTDEPAATATPGAVPTAEPAAQTITVKALMGTTGARVLITDQYEHAGGGKGTWRVARKPKPRGSLYVPGEPGDVHAATVERVESTAGKRYNVVTNLGTVEGLTAAQTFRTAPDDMRDSADIRRELREHREEAEARREFSRANPRGVDGVHVAAGDLVEAITVNAAMRAGRPGLVYRVLRPSGMGMVVVPFPYERSYGDCAAGEKAILHFRRLVDQTDGPTARRSCGCPTPVRSEIVPRPAEWSSALYREARDRDEADAAHLPACHWADREGQYAHPLRVLTMDTEEPRFEVHKDGCGCRSVVLHVTDVSISAYDVPGALLAMFPPQSHPDRDALPPVTFADCFCLVRDLLPSITIQHDPNHSARAVELLPSTAIQHGPNHSARAVEPGPYRMPDRGPNHEIGRAISTDLIWASPRLDPQFSQATRTRIADGVEGFRQEITGSLNQSEPAGADSHTRPDSEAKPFVSAWATTLAHPAS